MLKTIETLVSAFSSKKKGNHRVVFKGYERHFYYYFTEICTVNDAYKTFKTNDGGWELSPLQGQSMTIGNTLKAVATLT